MTTELTVAEQNYIQSRLEDMARDESESCAPPFVEFVLGCDMHELALIVSRILKLETGDVLLMAERIRSDYVQYRVGTMDRERRDLEAYCLEYAQWADEVA